MIYIDRLAVPAPELLHSEQVRATFEAQRAFFTDPANAAAIDYGRFDPDRFTVRVGIDELTRSLVTLFHNKCAFCESLLSTGDEFLEAPHQQERARWTAMMQRQVEDQKTKGATPGKQESFQQMSRGLRSTRDRQVIGVVEEAIGFFRPEYRAMNPDGTISHRHYWWLGWDWGNLYLLCRSCLNSKENRFPVVGDVRAQYQNQPLEGLRTGLEEEEALLLDPCRAGDFEERHFFFKEGRAVHLTEKGKTTISILSLNRPGLPEVRALAVDAFLEEYERRQREGQPVEGMLRPEHPFVAAILDHLWFDRGEQTEAREVCREVYAGELSPYYTDVAAAAPPESSVYGEAAIREKEAALRAETQYDLETKENLEAYFSQAIWIERVIIRDFKIFRHLEVDFPGTRSSSRPWLALLGENGVGKSSISQAIALTLMGQRKLEGLRLDPEDFIRRGAERAVVEVYLLNREEPVTLTIERTADGGRFRVEPQKPLMVVMGYGATRLLGDSSDAGEDPPFFIRARNLFNPLARLGNGRRWLTNPDDVDDVLFEQITGRLRHLLQLEDDQSIVRRREDPAQPYRLYLLEEREGDAPKLTPFKYLSSGYQTIVAMALDIMIGASDLLKTPGDGAVNHQKSLLDIDGIVLIDEIGVHLHPRWKMRIVKALKDTFPKLSFIITTHEPLCLRGLVEGEVVLLQKDEQNEVNIITDLPSPQALTIQQLLTSSFFGLSSIIDPELEQDYDRYYSLLARFDAESDPGKQEELREELEKLRQKLKDQQVTLGNSITEQIEYQRLIPGKVQLIKSKKDVFRDVDEEGVRHILDTWNRALED